MQKLIGARRTLQRVRSWLERLKPPVTARTPYFYKPRALSRPSAYIGDNLVLTKTVYGHKMCVESRSIMGAHILLDGHWEEYIVRHLFKYVRPGMRVVDVGANHGFYSLMLAELVGPTGHVFAFEPLPNLVELLRRNLELNAFQDRSTVVPKVLHAHSGTFAFVTDASYGNGTVTGHTALDANSASGQRHPGQPDHTRVEGVSLDEFLAGDPRPIDFMKIDAEGAEPLIFRGMQELLNRGRPMTIFCEYFPPLLTALGNDPFEFLNEITAHGFRISEITPRGIRKLTTWTNLSRTDCQMLLLVRGEVAR
jgi:FkbM family methyltransferase